MLKASLSMRAPARMGFPEHLLQPDISLRQNAMRLLFVFFLTLITVMSLIPAPAADSSGNLLSQWLANLFLGTGQHADKVTHFIAYGVLTGAGMLGRLTFLGRALFLALPVIVWSGLIEVGQYLTGYRLMDGGDLLANTIGACAGGLGGMVVLAFYDHWRVRRKIETIET